MRLTINDNCFHKILLLRVPTKSQSVEKSQKRVEKNTILGKNEK